MSRGPASGGALPLARALLAAALLVAGAWPGDARGFSGGVSGRSGKEGARCSQCHSAGATAAPVVMVSGPKEPMAGTLALYTVTVSGLAVGMGFDLAPSAGSLTITDPHLTMQAQGGDLSHTADWPRSSDTITFSLGWSVPAAPGPATLFVAILSVNGDGGTGGDAETYVTLDVTVQPPPDLAGADLAGLDLAIVDSSSAPAGDLRAPYRDERQWALACSTTRLGGPPGRAPQAVVWVALLVAGGIGRGRRRARRRAAGDGGRVLS